MDGLKVLFEKPGYKIMINPTTGDKAVILDEKKFTTILDNEGSFRIMKRDSDGQSFLQTNEWFCMISEVKETSKGVPVLQIVTIPDEFVGIMIGDSLIINPNKKFVPTSN